MVTPNKIILPYLCQNSEILQIRESRKSLILQENWPFRYEINEFPVKFCFQENFPAKTHRYFFISKEDFLLFSNKEYV